MNDDQPWNGNYEETTFFVDEGEDEWPKGVPATFHVKGMPLIPKGTLLYLHPDVVGPTYKFLVKESYLSVTGEPPADEVMEYDGRKYRLRIKRCRMRQEWYNS